MDQKQNPKGNLPPIGMFVMWWKIKGKAQNGNGLGFCGLFSMEIARSELSKHHILFSSYEIFDLGQCTRTKSISSLQYKLNQRHDASLVMLPAPFRSS